MSLIIFFFDCICLVFSLGLTAPVKFATFRERHEEVVALVVHTVHNNEILRLKHMYSWHNYPHNQHNQKI